MAPILLELSERDLRGALAVLHSVAEASEDCRSFVGTALNQLPELVASDLTTLSICDLGRGTRRVVGRPGESLSDADRATFDLHFRYHPLVRFHSSHANGPTQRISDCVEAPKFRDSALYADYYRPLGINYVMALPLRIDPSNVISVVFNRSRSDFRSSERAVLDSIRQPLAALYRKLIACDEAGRGLRCVSDRARDGGWQLMRVSMPGRILDASSSALALLAYFFPRDKIGRLARLPAPLSEWFSRSRSWGLERPAITGGEHFTASREGMKLTVHALPDPLDTAAGYLMLRSDRLGVQAAQLCRLPITEREREILALVAVGKTNREIATLLVISARTVQKHLEHIFQKLGVETRTAAAIRALTAARDHGLPV
jgi:DNA-binding CsgD family transcriptional regulator